MSIMIKDMNRTTITMNKLKPCPFCGCAAHVYEDERFSKKSYNFPKWYITCLGCGVSTPTAKMEQIVKTWNRRTENECNNKKHGDTTQLLFLRSC